tara:strand:+ start:12327 stop:13121 length:795 start_codon:yes stop_codon:yes gene_type:complete
MISKKKVALVTGAAGFLGEVFVEAMLDLNYKLVVADKNLKGLSLIEKKIKKKSKEYFILKLDVTKKKDIESSFKKIIKRYKKIDILINNASIDAKPNYKKNKKKLGFENFSETQWNLEINTNLKSVFLMSQKIGNYMSKKRSGIILNIGSDLSVISPTQSIYKIKNNYYKKPITYSVAKHAIVGLTKYLAEYWAKDNVRVNCLSPGSVNHNQHIALKKQIINLTPIGRLLEKKELKNIIKFLCSEKSRYITGQNILIDGGRTII